MEIIQIIVAFLTLNHKVKWYATIVLAFLLYTIHFHLNLPSILLYNILVFLVIVGVQIISRLNINQAIQTTSLAFINVYITDMLLNLVLDQFVIQISPNLVKLLVFVVSMFIYSLLAFGEKRLIDWLDRNWPRLANYLYLPIFLLFMILQIPALRTDYFLIAYQGLITFQLFVSLIGVLALIFIAILVMTQYAQFQYNRIQEMKAQDQIQMEYARLVQEQYGEIRKFRHDHRNVLIALESFISRKDWEGLSRFYSEELSDGVSDHPLSPALVAISRIQNPLIQNLLNIKLSYAINLGLHVTIEIPESVTLQMKNILPLTRVLGSLLDNAIEAASLIAEGEVHIAVMDIDSYELIVIKNHFVGEIKDLNQLNRPGYSTKGQDRGQGLAIVHEIIARYPMSLRTRIEKDNFIQELIIPREVDHVSSPNL